LEDVKESWEMSDEIEGQEDVVKESWEDDTDDEDASKKKGIYT
jgi:hypothetical protein